MARSFYENESSGLMSLSKNKYSTQKEKSFYSFTTNFSSCPVNKRTSGRPRGSKGKMRNSPIDLHCRLHDSYRKQKQCTQRIQDF
jgi:hypothetical protein